jgi:hypothetical protein
VDVGRPADAETNRASPEKAAAASRPDFRINRSEPKPATWQRSSVTGGLPARSANSIAVAVKELLVRQPKELARGESPLAAVPRPSHLGAQTLQPQHPMPPREKWGYVFWGSLGAFILVTEALAAFWSDFPVPTISGTTGHLELTRHWVKLIVVGGITILAARIAFYPWPYKRLDD